MADNLVVPDEGLSMAGQYDLVRAYIALTAERDRYKAALDEILQTLTIPAAEYVPAIGDVFLIIKDALSPAKEES